MLTVGHRKHWFEHNFINAKPLFTKIYFYHFRAKTIIDQWKKKATLYRSNSVFAPLGDDFRYDKTDEWDLQYVNYQKIFDYLNSHPELGVEVSEMHV